MKHAMAATASRTVGFSRLLLALAVAMVLGSTVVDSVDAKKNHGRKPTSIADRIKDEKTLCEKNGGKIWVTHKPGSATSTCNGGAKDGRECTHTRKSTVCAPARTQPPAHGGVTAPPSDAGLNPDGGDTGGGGGNNAGGGAVAPPTEADPDGGEPEQPTIQ